MKFFAGTGAGQSAPVKNNAEAMWCDMMSSSICYTFTNPAGVAPSDYMHGQEGGELVATKNNIESVRISPGP